MFKIVEILDSMPDHEFDDFMDRFEPMDEPGQWRAMPKHDDSYADQLFYTE